MITRTLCIIPAALRDTVNAAIYASPAFENKTEAEFSVPLYAADDEAQETPTHYWLSHPFTPEQRAAVASLAAVFPSAIVEDYTDQEFPAQRLIDLGLKVQTSSMA